MYRKQDDSRPRVFCQEARGILLYGGDAMKDRNHEGYHDPTACEAVRRAHRHKKESASRRTARTGYLLREVPGFQEVKRAVMR